MMIGIDMTVSDNDDQVLHERAGWLPASHPPDPHPAWGEALPYPPGETHLQSPANLLLQGCSLLGPAGEMVSLHEEQVKIFFQSYRISFPVSGGDRAGPGSANQYRAWLCLRPHWGAGGRPSVQVTSPPHSHSTSCFFFSNTKQLLFYCIHFHFLLLSVISLSSSVTTIIFWSPSSL